MAITRRVWGYDSRFVRCEALYDNGASFGVVWFEANGNDTGQNVPCEGARARIKFYLLAILILVVILVGCAAAFGQTASRRLTTVEHELDQLNNVTGELVQTLERLDQQLQGLRSNVAALNGARDTHDVERLVRLERQLARLERSLATAYPAPPYPKHFSSTAERLTVGRSLAPVAGGVWKFDGGARFNLSIGEAELYLTHNSGGGVSWAAGSLKQRPDGSYAGSLSGVFASDTSQQVRTVPVTIRTVGNQDMLELRTEYIRWDGRGNEISRSTILAYLRK